MKFSPTTDKMPSTPGIGRTMSSTSLTTVSVRLSETPSGSRSAAKMAPWSSSGKKLCGVLLNSHAEAAKLRDRDLRNGDDAGQRDDDGDDKREPRPVDE